MSSLIPLLAGIDGGGTTFKCGIAGLDGKIVHSARFPTTTPEATLAACEAYFISQCKERSAALAALGVGCFGPLNVDQGSPDYGAILNSPKMAWRCVNIRKSLANALQIQVVVDTDVNGALLAERRWGAAAGANCSAYLTIGTAIGGAVMIGDDLVGKPRHQELGHIQVTRHPDHAGFEAVCPIHGDCLEGLASAPAFTKAFGDPATLSPNHPGWETEAWYLAQACVSLSLFFRTDGSFLAAA